VASGEVVGSILFAGDKLLRVIQLSLGAGSDLIYDSGLQIDLDGSWHVFASSSLRKEGVEGIISSSNGLVGWHLSVRLNSVL